MKRLAMIFALGVFLVGSMATAMEPTQECTSDADCEGVNVCVFINEGSCSNCEPGVECPPCDSQSYSYCEPPPPVPCAADSDCDATDVCVSYEYESCSGTDPSCEVNPITGECADCVDEDCEASPQEDFTCTTNTEALCVPRYLAPCVADADCGGGFTCEPATCSCPVPLPGGDEGPTPSDCECDSAGTQYCRVIEVVCESDDDCEGELKCTDVSEDELILIGDDEDCSDCSTDPVPSPDPAALRCAPADEFGGHASNDEGDFQTGDRVSWADGTHSDEKQEELGCSATGTDGPRGLLLILLALGILGFRRRQG